jgi:glycosyltransferase involved in cell wall biosynthesis
MKLSIIIPTFNEEKTIVRILRQVKKVKLPKGVSREIIVVNDASSDNTVNKLKEVGGIRIVHHKKNKGKGAAVRTGIAKARGEVILVQDADLEYSPSDYPRLLKPILSGKAKVVYGSRLKDYPLSIIGRKRTPLVSHFIGNKFLTFITNILYGNKVTDMETCYKVFKKEILDGIQLKARRFDFEPEVTAKILKKGIQIFEIPIKVKPRGYSEGKKISWRDGFIALWTLIKYRFTD